ncbi:hypothetical protein Celaphus_00011118, partial [Cervus elaphus hippelaphus]
MLDGLDILLVQKDHPRRCKLQVLGLRNTGQDFWRIWSGSSVQVSSSSFMEPVAKKRPRTQWTLAPLEVFMELHINRRTMDGFLTYLMRWPGCVCSSPGPDEQYVSPLEDQEELHVVQIISQFLRLYHLQDLLLVSTFFLEGCLDQML